MRLSAAPRIKKAPRPAHKSAPGYLKWLRGRECILAAQGGCKGKVRACHWDQAGDKGMGTKVSDKWAFPMCDGHHTEQHRGWVTFIAKHGLTMRAICEFYWRNWHGRAAWERANG